MIEQRSLKDGIIEIIGESDDYTFTDEGVANFCLKEESQSETLSGHER